MFSHGLASRGPGCGQGGSGVLAPGPSAFTPTPGGMPRPCALSRAGVKGATPRGRGGWLGPHSFDFKGNAAEADGKSKGSFDVIGGSGKWAGATGKGKFKRIMQTDTGTKTVLEVEITTP